MKIVINHLTRMAKGFICVAGVDVETQAHVRPVLRGRLDYRLAGQHGGPFDIGAVVELGKTLFCGGPPEVEDYSFIPMNASRIDQAPPEEFWKLLRSLARPRLQDIFGEALQPAGRNAATALRKGIASLGCLALQEPPELILTEDNKLRLCFSDGQLSCSTSVSDLRFYEDDHVTPRSDRVREVTERINSGAGLILGVGLTRAYTKSGETVGRHYLQVNNIHLEDNPLWRVSGTTMKQPQTRSERADESLGSRAAGRVVFPGSMASPVALPSRSQASTDVQNSVLPVLGAVQNPLPDSGSAGIPTGTPAASASKTSVGCMPSTIPELPEAGPAVSATVPGSPGAFSPPDGALAASASNPEVSPMLQKNKTAASIDASGAGGREELFSEKVFTRRRSYFFDVKQSEDGARCLVISESRPLNGVYEHHRIVVPEESLKDFLVGLEQAAEFLGISCPAAQESIDSARPISAPGAVEGNRQKAVAPAATKDVQNETAARNVAAAGPKETAWSNDDPCDTAFGVDVKDVRKKHPRAYAPWTAAEDKRLRLECSQGASVSRMVESSQRPAAAVRLRLRMLGIPVPSGSRAPKKH